MKVSISWLKELVAIKDVKEIIRLLPLRTIGTKEITDDFIELDMKGYNRADLLSMRGVAREVAAITDSKINFSEEKVNFPDLPRVEVNIQDKKLCPVYCVAEIQNLNVEHSPDTWVKKLSDSGVRSINNVADVTNLVMLEYGQPMHAFDADKVESQTLVVRLALQGETLQTLDDKKRLLDKSDLLIADPKKPLGIAGVMGGKDSEVSNITTSILLEAAVFDPVSIRKTAKRHNLPSEASKRFQHGLTKTNLLQALSAAIKMYEQMGGKLTAITLTGNLEDEVKTIKLNQEKINSLIGVDISQEQVKNSLEKLGFHLQGVNVTVPYWRLDINIEEDLIEEVARMYGYENIPPQELRGKPPEKIDQTLPNLIYDLKKQLADLGLTEVQTYSFYSTHIIVNCELSIVNLIKISNPISSETEYMRDELWPNLLEVVAKNIKNGFKDIAIFEIGKVYFLPDKETYRLSIALMNNTDNTIQELYQIFNKVVSRLGLKISLGEQIGESAQRFHPNRYLYLNHQNKPIGKIGEVHPRIVNKFGIENRVAVLELELVVATATS